MKVYCADCKFDGRQRRGFYTLGCHHPELLRPIIETPWGPRRYAGDQYILNPDNDCKYIKLKLRKRIWRKLRGKHGQRVVP